MWLSLRRSLVSVIKTKRCIHNLTYEPATPSRYDEIMDHLRTVSYYDVPLYRAAGLIKDGVPPPPELDNVYYESLKEGVSLVVLDKGKFAGVLINGILTPDAVPGAIANMKKSTNLDYKKMDYMFLELLMKIDMFDRFGIDKAMECRLLSTTREYRGSGLGKILVDKLTDVARKNDFPLIIGEAVNDFLWRLLVVEGWMMIIEMSYDDYTDEVTGKPIFKVDPPHHILGVCGRIVDNKCKSKDPLPLPPTRLIYPKVIK